MAKKIKFESFKYRLLIAFERKRLEDDFGISTDDWLKFLASLGFLYKNGFVTISWDYPMVGSLQRELTEAIFYSRGDRQPFEGVGDIDTIKNKNEIYFSDLASNIMKNAGLFELNHVLCEKTNLQLEVERDFHDQWANSENLDNIDILKANESETAPEMRFIKDILGDISGKALLDVGCGLGEASVFFALLGAKVTSVDLSPGMLSAASTLAKKNGVSVTTHLASAENINLSSSQKYDVIYAGNLLHHVDIEKTLQMLKPHLKDSGVLVTWDPLAYNPIINIYRLIAKNVRTPDEHPLTLSDLKIFKKLFPKVRTEYFWLFTLLIFILMFFVERRNPNKERFWKVVVQEGDRWSWLYKPLASLDRLVLKVFPPLRLLCWNVVVVCHSCEK